MSGKKFSLSFTKTIEKKNLQPSAIRNDAPQETKLYTESLESIEENVMKTDGKIEETELVIPLVATDRISILRRIAEKKLKDDANLQEEESTSSSSSKSKELAEVPSENKILTLDEQAEAAIIEESKKILEEWSDRGEKSNMTIANVVTEDLMETEVAVGKESSLDDYDQVDVSVYGAALLRGMGWDKKEGIGRINKGVVEVIDPTAKTFGLGNKGTNKTAENKTEDNEELVLAKGSYVFIHSGRRRGVYGTVDALDEDHLMVKSAVGQDLIREVEANVRVVSQKEYKDSSRVINKDMYDKYKEDEAARKNKKIKRSSSKDSDDSDSADAKENRKESTSERKESQKESFSQSKERQKEESSHSRESNKELILQSNDKQKERTSQDLSKDSLTEKEKPSYLPYSKEESDRNLNEKSEIKAEHSDYERKKLNVKKEHEVSISRKYENRHSENDRKDKIRDYSKSKYERYDDGYRHEERYKDEEKLYRREEKYKATHNDNHLNRSTDKERDKYYDKPCAKYDKDLKKEKMHKRREDKSDIYQQDYKKAKVSQEQMPAMPWVRENLRVRLISKEYKGGRYHKEKVIVKFVETAESCECITEEGKTIRNVHPEWLETVIPKVHPQNILIVKGSQKGQRARILQLHKDQEMASVQLMDDNSVILKLHYDDICEYVSRW